jgi:prevent-host-death family protein
MPKHRIPATEAREKLADILNTVAFRGERVLLDRHGKSVAAIVSVEDLALLERLEDEMDLDAARKAIADKGPRISWKDLKAELGI